MTGQDNLSKRLKIIEKRLSQLCCAVGNISENYVQSFTMLHDIVVGQNIIPHGLGVTPKIIIVKDNKGYVVDFADLNANTSNITLTSGENYDNAIFEILIQV